MSTAFTTLAEALERGEAVHFWREPRYDGLECLSATFRTHRYVPHTHETYAVAAVLDGCEAFNHRGARHYVPVGSLAVVCPDELHDGEPAGEGFVYRTLYPSVELMRSVAEEISGKPFSGTPGFAQSVVEDAQLAGELAWLHATLANPAKAVLERDTRVMAFFANLLRRHGGIDARPQLGGESPSIVRARDYLDAHFAEEVTLEDLAAVARLNRAHFVRAFRKALGITPHAYLLDRRFRAAARMLAAGDDVAEVALACGLYDQSHLNRVFKARMGVTPGAFRG